MRGKVRFVLADRPLLRSRTFPKQRMGLLTLIGERMGFAYIYRYTQQLLQLLYGRGDPSH
jgi:hypothetical protein